MSDEIAAKCLMSANVRMVSSFGISKQTTEDCLHWIVDTALILSL